MVFTQLSLFVCHFNFNWRPTQTAGTGLLKKKHSIYANEKMCFTNSNLKMPEKIDDCPLKWGCSSALLLSIFFNRFLGSQTLQASWETLNSWNGIRRCCYACFYSTYNLQKFNIHQKRRFLSSWLQKRNRKHKFFQQVHAPCDK